MVRRHIVAGDTMIQYPPQAWEEYRARRDDIAGILDPRCYTIDWLDLQILNGDALVFGSNDAVIIITVKQYPAGATELHGLAATGDLEAILPLIEQAEDWARSKGVTFACISSRPGWVRVLKSNGYSVTNTELRKDL
jgi:hypothetical protein